MKEAIEDALTLGNSARDDKPPRYEDAEIAYQLAAKLSPGDSRPYVGLGNIYYDQKKHEEAARAYREALRLATLEQQRAAILKSAKVGGTGNFAGSQQVATKSGVEQSDVAYAELQANLGSVLLVQEKWAEAESQLRDAVITVPNSGQLHALLGYALYKQNKYSEAAISFERAASIEPQNTLYTKLLEQVNKEQKK